MNDSSSLAIIVALVAVVVVLVAIVRSIRIVRPYERGLVEQLGKYKETMDPGMHLIIPFVQKMRAIDMREQVVDVPPQEVITSDNVVVSVDAVVYYEPTDPQRLAYNVANFLVAIIKLTQTNLRNVIGDMALDEALTSRDTLNTELRDILDGATDKWGVRIGRVEIQRIDPPPDVMAAMHEQMKSERNRRAQVTAADGYREASIARAEGEKQAAILGAEGERQRRVLEAEGRAQATRTIADAERYRAATVADGEAAAILTVFNAIHDGQPTADLLAVKSLEALARIGDGQATKILLPVELGGLGGVLAAAAELVGDVRGLPSKAPDGQRKQTTPIVEPAAEERAAPPTSIVSLASPPDSDDTDDTDGVASDDDGAEDEDGDGSTGTATEGAGSGAPGWYADPTGRYAQRYRDVTGWTSNVADVSGTTLEDPLGAG